MRVLFTKVTNSSVQILSVIAVFRRVPVSLICIFLGPVLGYFQASFLVVYDMPVIVRMCCVRSVRGLKLRIRGPSL